MEVRDDDLRNCGQFHVGILFSQSQDLYILYIYYVLYLSIFFRVAINAVRKDSTYILIISNKWVGRSLRETPRISMTFSCV